MSKGTPAIGAPEVLALPPRLVYQAIALKSLGARPTPACPVVGTIYECWKPLIDPLDDSLFLQMDLQRELFGFGDICLDPDHKISRLYVLQLHTAGGSKLTERQICAPESTSFTRP